MLSHKTGNAACLAIANYSPANFSFSASCTVITLNSNFASTGANFTNTTGLFHLRASEHLYNNTVYAYLYLYLLKCMLIQDKKESPFNSLLSSCTANTGELPFPNFNESRKESDRDYCLEYFGPNKRRSGSTPDKSSERCRSLNT